MKQNGLSEKLTLRVVLLAIVAMVIVMMTVLLVSVIKINNQFSNQLDSDLNKILLLQSRITELDETTSALSNYVLSGEEEYLKSYVNLSQSMSDFVFAAHTLTKEDPGYYLYVDLENIFQSFLEQSVRTKDMFESGQVSLYVNNEIFNLIKNKDFVKAQLSKIITYELDKIEDKYGDIEAAARKREEIVYFMVFAVIILTYFIAILLAKRLTHPIEQLSKELRLIGKGEYDQAPLLATGIGEITLMIRGFNKMKSRLAENIELIYENNRIKEQLALQKIELLASENHLKQSKLDFLQSQINPHFLYNTLNSIQTLADIEEAPQTEKMLQYLSFLMRYNVKKTSSLVTIEEELEVINCYVNIQLIRFGNKIHYEVDCEPEVRGIMLPSMILQPLVENAMIHGLEPKMGEGLLTISAKRIEDKLQIIIKDNGLGMEKEIIDKLMSYGVESELKLEEQTNLAKSIGVANVIRRCCLYYGKNVVDIQSVVGEYSMFTFNIPYESGD